MNQDFVFKIREIPKIEALPKKALFILEKTENQPNIIETLNKMATAINLDLVDDLQFLWLEKSKKFNVGPILPNYKNVVIFGLSPQEIGLNVTKMEFYKIYNSENSSLHISESVTNLNDDKTKKLQFWNALQKQFIKK